MSSVQSAWEDLVVDNPNRAKLEACLLTTIMLVVLCIFALLTYVYVQLQPAGNVVMRPSFWKTKFTDTYSDRQFAYRLMGWMNWSSTRCLGMSEWACGGRLVEASGLAIYETAETAAADYAKEYAAELIDRIDAVHVVSPTTSLFNISDKLYPINCNTTNVPRLSQFLRLCRKGYPTMADFLADFDSVFKLKFVENSQSGTVWEKYRAMQKDFNYFPLGYQYLTDDKDKDANLNGKPAFVTMEPPRLIARPYDKGNAQFMQVMKAGFSSINAAVKGCCGDNGEGVARHEFLILEEMAKATFQTVDKGTTITLTKVTRDMVDVCKELNTIKEGVECRHRNLHVPEALLKLPARGADAINWALLKLFILLAPLMPADEPSLTPFFKLVAWYHRRAEMPHKDLLCMDLAEMFFPFALEKVINQTHFVSDAPLEMLAALKKLDAQLSTPGDDKKGASSGDKSDSAQDGTVFGTLLKNSPSSDSKQKGAVVEFWQAGYDRIVFFAAREPPKDTTNFAVPAAQGNETVTAIAYLNAALPQIKAEQIPRWLGSRFSGNAKYDLIRDRIYAPLGLAMPPFFHPNATVISHSTPGFTMKLGKALIERYVHAFLYKKPERTPEGYKPDPATQKKMAMVVPKAIDCYSKAVSPFMMWDLFYTRSAVTLAYQIWRRGYNHASANADTQLRLQYLKFLSEETLFFIIAANAVCEVANPKFASKKDVEIAPKIANLVVHCPLLGESMLCDKKRPVFKADCGGVFPPISRSDEALFTVEAWRRNKRVVWSP